MKRRSFRNWYLSIGVAALVAGGVTPAFSQSVTETTTSTTYSGTVSELTPSSSSLIVRSESAAPRTYVYSNKTLFLDPSGNVVSAEVTRGQPVTLYYRQEGDQMVLTKVVMSRPAGTVTETTTETRRPSGTTTETTTETRREVR